jgi:hypothetical protein
VRGRRRGPGRAESFWDEKNELWTGRGGLGIRAVRVGGGAGETGDEAAGLGLDLVEGEGDGGQAGPAEVAGQVPGRVEEGGEVGHGLCWCLFGWVVGGV